MFPTSTILAAAGSVLKHHHKPEKSDGGKSKEEGARRLGRRLLQALRRLSTREEGAGCSRRRGSAHRRRSVDKTWSQAAPAHRGGGVLALILRHPCLVDKRELATPTRPFRRSRTGSGCLGPRRGGSGRRHHAERLRL